MRIGFAPAIQFVYSGNLTHDVNETFQKVLNRLPLTDEFRNWLYSEEAEKLCKELTTIT
jgi:hypothetical protein